MVKFNDKDSLDRPAWTSSWDTGQLEAYKHKHVVYRGEFRLLENYYIKSKGTK